MALGTASREAYVTKWRQRRSDASGSLLTQMIRLEVVVWRRIVCEPMRCWFVDMFFYPRFRCAFLFALCLFYFIYSLFGFNNITRRGFLLYFYFIFVQSLFLHFRYLFISTVFCLSCMCVWCGIFRRFFPFFFTIFVLLFAFNPNKMLKCGSHPV